MNFGEFFKEARETGFELTFDNQDEIEPLTLDNEALFQLPLLAITVLLLAKDRSKPKTDNIGRLVGECFERTFVGFKGSSQDLSWSANLRMRSIRALTFLEMAMLVNIDKNNKKIQATTIGKKVISKALSAENDLAINLRIMEREYRNIRIEKQISIGL